MDIQVKILGSRGSIPVSGNSYVKYGGNTTCILVKFSNNSLLIDAGTGLLNLPNDVLKYSCIHLILSHPHLDHIMGLPMCKYMFNKDNTLNIYGVDRNNLDLHTQINRVISNPIWPVTLDELPTNINYNQLDKNMTIGEMVIYSIDGDHPGGVSVFRLEYENKSIVIMTDCNINESNFDELVKFSKNCDLLICDGQYNDIEYKTKSNFGHSSWETAARFAKSCNAKKLLVTHHDPFRSDDILDSWNEDLSKINENYRFAKDGDELSL